MELVKDILINEDVEFKNGDFVIGVSDQQHIEHILKTKPGQFYQFPTLGVGVVDLINSSINRQALKQKIKVNLESDNYRINKVEVAGEIDELKTSIDAIRLK